ncbi:MAG: S26 family signal peptidase [Bacteroidales bacterium]|nr:MAG: S26 family signal peptidase [Bacteroidales bacterium]
MDLLKNKYFKFGLAGTAYILWVIWVGSYWLLPGLGIVFDIYVSKKVNWAFWKKRNKPNSTLIEWLDALIFAVIAVTFINIFFFQNYRIPTGSMEKSLLIGDHLFVSKLSYGPRMPNTPLSFPFTQNTLPIIKTKSYLEWIKRPYKRLAGFGKINNNDVVVFNFPAGDTVCLESPEQSYESIVRSAGENFRQRDRIAGLPEKSDEEYYSLGREQVWQQYTIIDRPVDKRDNYIKRCIGIPGDTIEIIQGHVYVNGKMQAESRYQQFSYQIETDGTPINPLAFDRLGIARADRHSYSNSLYMVPLTEENAGKIRAFRNVTRVEKYERPEDEYVYYIFPHNPKYRWNEDHFGPLWIPKKGSVLKLTMENISFYKRIIQLYEKNDLKIENNKFFINGEEATEYTFKMDYYWLMGDNRHDSLDGRFWGFVPEDHIVGKPKIIWLSLDKEKKFLAKIRWKRMFMRVR